MLALDKTFSFTFEAKNFGNHSVAPDQDGKNVVYILECDITPLSNAACKINIPRQGVSL